MTKRRPTTRTIQRTPDLGLRVRLQREQPAALPADPVRILDPDGELIDRVSCGESYQIPSAPCQSISTAYWADVMLRTAYATIDGEEALGSDVEGAVRTIVGRPYDMSPGREAQDIRIGYPLEGDLYAYECEGLPLLGIAVTDGDTSGIEWDVTVDRPDDLATSPEGNDHWWAGATWRTSGPLLELSIGPGGSTGGEAWAAIITATPRCGPYSGPTIRVTVDAPAF